VNQIKGSHYPGRRALPYVSVVNVLHLHAIPQLAMMSGDEFNVKLL